MLSIGLINILNKVKHAPTISAVTITGLSVIPDTIYVVANTEAESIIQCKIIFINKIFSPYPKVGRSIKQIIYRQLPLRQIRPLFLLNLS